MDNVDLSKKKRIAIIGGGASGIGSIAALKEEGIEPVCFEASDRYGGTWNYREDSTIGYASIMPTTVLNHSKEIGAASNFPPRKEYNNFMRHQEVFQYLTEYYEHHQCEKYIHFNTEVINVKKADDYDATGRFLVTVKDKISGKVSTDIYDGVMVCTGHFTIPKMEHFPGLENFKGTVMHTHSLKTVEKFKGQNVLIIGAGCSGLDAAEVISSVAKQVYLSVRHGMLVFNRVGPNGYPIDYIMLRRYLLAFLDILPIQFCSWYIQTFYMDTKFDSNFYYVQPKYHVLAKDPVLNDAIPSKLLAGSVLQKGSAKHFTENGVLFDGDDNITEIDAVIMATGYKWAFSFLEDGLLQTEDGRINLYKCMYPSQLTHSSLVFIGFINPFGPGIPIGELQCRYAAQIFADKVKLPSNGIMLKDAIERHRKNEERYLPSGYTSVQIDVISYCDDIASKFGVKPNLIKYFFTDFPLFLKLVFGPSVPYQYRLEGPHKWEGAREAIMTCNERLCWPLSREKKTKKGILQIVFEFIGHLIPSNIFVY